MKHIVRTTTAPNAIGPYSQAVSVAVGDRKMIFCSGQIALDPATGALVEGDIEVQTRQVMANVGAVLLAAGGSWKHVVKTTIFLASMDDFGAVNAVYGEAFPVDPPARSTVQAARLPRDAKVEIEVTAIV
ncbi:MAG TPA: Rid family detoxifying hydrolase [Kofleriaceae bacterium]|jgi:2-iminobutanoate/2-iminopropanoate deaminase